MQSNQVRLHEVYLGPILGEPWAVTPTKIDGGIQAALRLFLKFGWIDAIELRNYQCWWQCGRDNEII